MGGREHHRADTCGVRGEDRLRTVGKVDPRACQIAKLETEVHRTGPSNVPIYARGVGEVFIFSKADIKNRSSVLVFVQKLAAR